MTTGQGWAIISLLASLLIVGVFILLKLEDIHTTMRLMDVACY